MEQVRNLEPEGVSPRGSGEGGAAESALRKPGELGMAAIMFALGALGYYFALDMTSGEYSSPSVFPKLASVIIMAGSAYNFLKALKRGKGVFSDGLVKYLLPADVVVIVLLLVGYCIVLPHLHFIPSSYAFMVIAMVYLQRGKKIPQALIISALFLALLVAVFRYLFLVILP